MMRGRAFLVVRFVFMLTWTKKAEKQLSCSIQGASHDETLRIYRSRRGISPQVKRGWKKGPNKRTHAWRRRRASTSRRRAFHAHGSIPRRRKSCPGLLR